MGNIPFITRGNCWGLYQVAKFQCTVTLRQGQVLTVNVVTEDSDTLLVQGHHLWEVGSFGARVHLHFRI